MPPEIRLKVEDYTVGWISALPIEHAAATAMLDEEHVLPINFSRDANDQTFYTFGRIGPHNVVLACLNYGWYGTISAAWTAGHLAHRFPSLRIGLLVGIGGGIPSEIADIRLGDVVISSPSGQHGGVVQYDYGKQLSGGKFQRSGSLNSPPRLLLNAISHMRSREILGRQDLSKHLSVFDLLDNAPFSRDKAGSDILYDGDKPKERPPRSSTDPVCHYGVIASGDRVMKDSVTRDRIAKEIGAICFEMEAAGIMNDYPCLVVRGIADYADGKKTKQWQPYAAATAAAYAKELLEQVPKQGSVSATEGAGDLVESNSSESTVALEHDPQAPKSTDLVRSGTVDSPQVLENHPQTTSSTIELQTAPQARPTRPRRNDPKKQEQEEAVGTAGTVPMLGSNSQLSTIGLKPPSLPNEPRQPRRTRPIFTMFDRSIHIYGEVYYGNGTIMRSIINNQGGSITSSGGPTYIGNAAGPISSNIGGTRTFTTQVPRSHIKAASKVGMQVLGMVRRLW